MGACSVCGCQSGEKTHYGGKVCFSCKAFFRRCVRKGSTPQIAFCNRISEKVGECKLTERTRNLCW